MKIFIKFTVPKIPDGISTRLENRFFANLKHQKILKISKIETYFASMKNFGQAHGFNPRKLIPRYCHTRGNY